MARPLLPFWTNLSLSHHYKNPVNLHSSSSLPQGLCMCWVPLIPIKPQSPDLSMVLPSRSNTTSSMRLSLTTQFKQVLNHPYHYLKLLYIGCLPIRIRAAQNVPLKWKHHKNVPLKWKHHNGRNVLPYSFLDCPKAEKVYDKKRYSKKLSVE